MRSPSLRFPTISAVKMSRAALALGALLALAAAPSQATIVIDNFTTAQALLIGTSTSGPQNAFSEASSAVSIGGFRDIFVARTSNNSGTVNADSNFSVSNVFAFSANLGTAGFARLQYDGQDNNGNAISPTGLGGISLLEPGIINNRFRFQALSDLGGDVIVRLYSGAGNVSTGVFFVPGDPAAQQTLSFQTFQLPFASFTTTSGTGANFANIGAIEIELGTRLGSPVFALDVAIDIITIEGDLAPTAVPEPGTLALVGLGTVLAGIFRRRRT